MNPIEGVLLSLTCKSLWAQVTLQKDVLRELKRCSPLGEAMHLLRMLEKDNYRYVVCTLCFRLHSRMRHESKRIAAIGELIKARRPCSEELGGVRTQGSYSQRLVVYRETVELVLRAATLGRDFGLPLKCLRQSNEWEVFGAAHLKVHFASDAAIVPVTAGENGPHLFVKASYIVELDLRRSLSAQIKKADISGCRHDAEVESRHIVTAIETTKGDPLTGRPLNVLRCPVCPTDLVVEVHYKPREVFAEVCVTAYRDLGPRGDHMEQIWARQKVPWIHNSDFDRGTKYAFGNQMLLHLWEQAKRTD